MTEPVVPVVSLVRNGTLILGGTAPDYADGTDFACDAKSIKLSPDTSTDGDPVELMCGTTLAAPINEKFTLNGTGIQRFNESDRMQAYAFAHSGETVHFKLTFNDTASPVYEGQVQIVKLEEGGDVGTNPGDLNFSFDGVGMYTRTPQAAPLAAEDEPAVPVPA